MRKYQQPEMEVIEIRVVDVITASDAIQGGDAGTGSGTGSSGPGL